MVRLRLGLCLVLGALPCQARDSGRAERAASLSSASRWSSDAILPLAVIRSGKFTKYERCQLDAEEPDGSLWRAVDAWGQVTGTVKKESRQGDELTLQSGSRGVGVYVRADARWSPPPSAEWRPNPSERERFERWRKARPALKGAVRFFTSSPSASRFAAVIGSHQVTIARLDDGPRGWQQVHAVRDQYRWPLFAFRAIVDMTGDGMPELVYHFNEYDDGRGHEVVLTAKNDGRSWRQASDNFDDCP